MSASTEPVIDSRKAFHEAVTWGFREAIGQGARRIVCVDANFADWPWDDAATLQALAGWLRQPHRRLDLLARSYAEVPRRSPRFNAWRRDWMHAITAWQIPDDWTEELPCLLVSDGAVSVQLIDNVHWRGRARQDSRAARQWIETVDVVLQRSEQAFAVKPLGL
jgi:hypothetical protein